MIRKIADKVLPICIQRFCIDCYYFLKSFRALRYRGSRYKCPFCNHSFSKFLPAGVDSAVLKKKKIIGGGRRQNVLCPFCSSIDRERLVYVFIKENNLLFKDMKLLHVAPERNLKRVFERKKINYFSADLKSALARIKMDIQKIKFPDNYFDGIICNHVLEHIVDDRKAMAELLRVLMPGGWAILQVPFSPLLKNTFEDFSVVDADEREMVFGQSDHVRIYGADYVSRLRSVGFKADQKKLSDVLIKKFALNGDELVFFCRKSK